MGVMMFSILCISFASLDVYIITHRVGNVKGFLEYIFTKEKRACALYLVA